MYVLPLAISPASERIGFSDWLELLTLCFAPLVAHLVAGASAPVYLQKTLPRWHERACHYNPTSILWRYFAITDRRCRAKDWNSFDMAASNALFWTADGWDGSEEMMVKSRLFCTRTPSMPRIALFSGAAIKTAIVAFQGLQAIYYVAIPDSSASMATLFFPVALLGLLRIPPALWLSEDYSYADVGAQEDGNRPDAKHSSTRVTQPPITVRPLQTDAAIPRSNTHPTGSWRGILVRAGFSLFVLALTAFSLSYLVLQQRGFVMTLTNYLQIVYFFLLGAISFTILCFYFYHGHRSKTTVIPCINSLWYKVYTGTLVVSMLVLIAVAAVETRKAPCGAYTTIPAALDFKGCPNGLYLGARSKPGSYSSMAGLFPELPASNNSQVVLRSFDGWCKGTFGRNYTAVVPAGLLSNPTGRS
jgi:hypothetical protein